MCSSCGSLRLEIFQLRSATIVSCVWMTCCMHAQPANPAPTPSSGGSTSSSTIYPPFVAFVCTSTRKQTRRGVRWEQPTKKQDKKVSKKERLCVPLFRRKAHTLAWSASPFPASQADSLWSSGTQWYSPVFWPKVAAWEVPKSSTLHCA